MKSIKSDNENVEATPCDYTATDYFFKSIFEAKGLSLQVSDPKALNLKIQNSRTV